MHPFAEDADRQRGGENAAQRGGQPQLLIVAATRIEADNQRGIADFGGKVIDIELSESDENKARTSLKDMCEKLLANTVIEKYEIELKP